MNSHKKGRFTLWRSYFFSTYRNFQCFIILEVIVSDSRALNWKQKQVVTFMQNQTGLGISLPDFLPLTLFYLVYSIQTLVKIGFGHDSLCCICKYVFPVWGKAPAAGTVFSGSLQIIAARNDKQIWPSPKRKISLRTLSSTILFLKNYPRTHKISVGNSQLSITLLWYIWLQLWLLPKHL